MSPSRVTGGEPTERGRPALPEEFPVLIVGGGPCGLLQAYCLAKLGVRSLVIERYAKRLLAPKAHALSPRSLEICRQFDLDTGDLRHQGTPRGDAFWVNFITNISGEQVGRLPYERMDPGVLEFTPEMIHNIPQPAFEETIAHELSRLTSTSVHKNISFVSCEEIDGTVFTMVENRITGEQYKIQSSYVLACDGARSKVRQYLGVESEGEDSYETMMTIHFNADLRPVVKERVGMLHWVLDPEVSGFIIGYDLSDNQVLICGFDSKKHPLESWNEELCRKKVDAAIGKKIAYDILSFRPWILSRKVAKSYRVGNVFLIGDAAHSFPPTGGLGLNCGLADVHNVSYKIAAVLQGWATDRLLDTYQAERQHVASVYSQQSVKNGKSIFGFLKSLGATEADISLARQNLHRSLNDPGRKLDIDNFVLGQRAHFDNLGLHIGYVYGRTDYPSDASVFTPELVPNARFPHAWIKWINKEVLIPKSLPIDVSYVSEFSPEDISLRQYSSLDLCSPGHFTFIASKASTVWTKQKNLSTLIESLKEFRIPLNVYVHGEDFEVADAAATSSWVDLLRLEDDGGVLVRPDQHVLMTVGKATTVKDVLYCIRQHLGIDLPSSYL